LLKRRGQLRAEEGERRVLVGAGHEVGGQPGEVGDAYLDAEVVDLLAQRVVKASTPALLAA